MALFAPEGGGASFELPTEGVTRGVCADVIDLGVRPGFENKPTHKVALVFQVDQTGKDGKPIQVQQWFTLSMNEKSNLRKFLSAWRGKQFELGEAGKFDLLTLVGKNALLTLVHSKPNAQGKVYGNIQSVSPLMKGMEELKIRDYERREAKAEDQTPGFMRPKAGDPF
jgi:hypothetical protein